MVISNTRPRPAGFDYNQPDPKKTRCMACNPDGFNRTGLRPVKWIGSSSTGQYGVPCGCKAGLKNEKSPSLPTLQK